MLVYQRVLGYQDSMKSWLVFPMLIWIDMEVSKSWGYRVIIQDMDDHDLVLKQAW